MRGGGQLYLLIKRLVDFVGSVILLIILFPLFIVVAVLIKNDSPGSIFYAAKRVGKNGKPFLLYKFRSMVVDADKGDFFTSDNDSRITDIGRTLRITSVDEFPQIINVLKGEMSFIGPRPIALQQENEYSPEDFRKRHVVLPGLSGLAQVSGRSDLTYEQKKYFDLYYAEHISLSLDLSILVKTIKTVWKRTGIN